MAPRRSCAIADAVAGVLLAADSAASIYWSGLSLSEAQRSDPALALFLIDKLAPLGIRKFRNCLRDASCVVKACLRFEQFSAQKPRGVLGCYGNRQHDHPLRKQMPFPVPSTMVRAASLRVCTPTYVVARQCGGTQDRRALRRIQRAQSSAGAMHTLGDRGTGAAILARTRHTPVQGRRKGTLTRRSTILAATGVRKL